MPPINFRVGLVTTFRHSSRAGICQMPAHRISRLAKRPPAKSPLSTGTVGLVENCFMYAVSSIVEWRLKSENKCLFLDLAPPTL